MARNPIIRETPPRIPTTIDEETLHACYEGWAYLGFDVEDEQGDHVEVKERVPCRRTADETL